MSTRYRVCFSRVALLLLGFAVAAAAQDELCETVWIVSPDGTLLGWPDPTVEDAPNDPTHKPFVVFDTSPSACTDCMCPWAMALLLVPGPSDLASLCDPERHLKKTNRLPFDEMLLLGYVPKELAKSGTDRARRRGFLDALMSWRVLGSRGLKEGASMLEGMSEAKELDPIMRLAAADVAAMLEGRKLPAVDLPPLDGLPTDADVLVVIDQRRLPPWRDVWRLHRVWTVREMRQVIARVGAAVTSADLCDAQWFMDRESEGYYELARRFGNARAHRSVLALRFPEGSTALSAAKYLLCCDGLFETENFRLGCGACGVKPRDGPEGAVAAQFGDLDVTVAPERLVVSRGFAVPPAGAGIPADLAKLGLGGDDAIWVHCRAVPFGELLPFTGLEA